tara:strand:- start:195 stop:398 length:204 start_codon:yes stop_codon:yes gene_type:complete
VVVGVVEREVLAWPRSVLRGVDVEKTFSEQSKVLDAKASPVFRWLVVVPRNSGPALKDTDSGEDDVR